MLSRFLILLISSLLAACAQPLADLKENAGQVTVQEVLNTPGLLGEQPVELIGYFYSIHGTVLCQSQQLVIRTIDYSSDCLKVSVSAFDHTRLYAEFETRLVVVNARIDPPCDRDAPDLQCIVLVDSKKTKVIRKRNLADMEPRETPFHQRQVSRRKDARDQAEPGIVVSNMRALVSGATP